MRIIDNRYKIEEILEYGDYFEKYRISDLWEDDKIQIMKIYNHNVQKELIDYLTENFIYLSNINHKYILTSENFNLVKTIDTKKVNMSLYYSISEYIHSPRLIDVKEKLTFKEKLIILLDVMNTIDFLHFRGFTYKILSPLEIFITEDKNIKLMDLFTVIEKKYNSKYEDLTRYFVSPEALINKDENSKRIDYYSLGVLIKYLLLKDFLVDDINLFIYTEDELLTENQKDKLNNIIIQLTKRDFNIIDINLLQVIDEINKSFNLNYSYDLVESRNSLFFNNKIIGREKEISKIMTIDKQIENNTNKYKGLVINGDFGVGKSRLINEIFYRLELKGRDVYCVEISENQGNDLLDMANILKQSLKDTHPEIIEKYRNELSKILPELRLNINDNVETDLNQNTEKFRLYNRITNYFIEISKEKIIYIIIDDIQRCNDNFVMLLDYLIKNTKSDNVFFVFSFEERYGEDILIKEKIKEWEKDSYIRNINLHELDLEEIGMMVQNILGMAYIPYNLSSILYKESQGNPRYLEYIIKYLFTIGELYIHNNGKWYLKVDSYSDLYFPSNFDDALKKQLNIIKENYFDIFKTMTIFNNALNKKILVRTLNINQDELEIALEELIDLKLIDEKLADWGYSYTINNSELKKLIYYEIPQTEKVELHKKVSEAIQELYEDKLELMLEELIYHLIKSNQSGKALDIILENFKKLENRYGIHAKVLLENAYDIIKNTNSIIKLEVLENLVEIYSLKSETEKGNAYLEEYIKEAEFLKDYKHIIKGISNLADIYYRKGQNDLSIKCIKYIEDISEENNIIEGKIISLSLRAKIEVRKGNIKEAQILLYQAIDLSNTFGIKTYMGTLYNRLGLSKALSGNINEAIDNYKKSIEYHLETGTLIEATRPINNIGTIYADHYADSKKAMENYNKGLEIATKFGVQELEITFLNNIAELYMKNYEFEEALKCMDKVRKGAIELQDLNLIFLSHINMGKIYISTAKYDKAYECYTYLKEMLKIQQFSDLEINVHYYSFLGDFYGRIGQWEKGIKNYNIAIELCKEFSIREYLKAQCKIFYLRFFNESYFNKDEIEKIRVLYRGTKLTKDRRIAILYFSIICFLQGDMEYALELLEEDNKLSNIVKNDFLEKMREAILYGINPTNESIENIIDMESKLINSKFQSMKLYLNILIAFELYSKGQYKRSIKYLLEALDIIYKISLKISDINLKLSYIESRRADSIKEKVRLAIKREYNCHMDYLLLENINEENIYDYFDITPIINNIGSEEFVKIVQLKYYDDTLDVKNIEDLISRFNVDFGHNLHLILSYLGKETLAKKGMILSYSEKNKKYEIVSSLDKDFEYKINEGILDLAEMNKDGILINSNSSLTYGQKYDKFLSNEIKGIICVPIIMGEDGVIIGKDRRKYSYKESNIRGCIYLETDKVFNRFDMERLEMIRKLSYLIFINLENNRLKLMATTDKLTGTFTRKYYEDKFQQLINIAKLNNEEFAILMLDIDKFKSINDNYGHRKGDEVLNLIGYILKSAVRHTDVVARYGGEEFVILLKGIEEKEVQDIAEKIRNNIESLKIQGIAHSITVSIGIAIYPRHSQFKEELIEKADQALYYAKETGRNKSVLWNTQMNNTINRVDKLAGILTGSMDEDNRNILAFMDIIELIKQNRNIKEKIFIFLGRLLETMDAELATMVLIKGKEKKKSFFTRARFDDDWVGISSLNYKIIDRVIETKKGEFLIDWDNIENIDSLSGLPNWQSIIVLPLIKNEKIKGVLYISNSLKNKEFDFNSFNLAKNIGDIFAAII